MNFTYFKNILKYYHFLILETYTYQGPVHFRKLGECVTLNAQVYFKESGKESIIWKKDSQVLGNNSRITVNGKT